MRMSQTCYKQGRALWADKFRSSELDRSWVFRMIRKAVCWEENGQQGEVYKMRLKKERGVGLPGGGVQVLS